MQSSGGRLKGRGKPLPNTKYNITVKGECQMKKYVYLLPFIIAMLSVFIKEQTIYTRIIFAVLGLLSLTTAILQTKELYKLK